MALSAEERQLRARIAAYEKWANTADRTAATAAARRAFEKKFESYPDPESARRAYFARLSFESSKARRRRKAAT